MATETETRPGAVVYAADFERLRRFYETLCEVELAAAHADHVVLESASFQLVIVRVPDHVARSFEVVSPPVRLEETPIKLVFPVAEIAALRGRVAELGGAIDPVESEWEFGGVIVCDAHDPEGNVIQFRERRPRSR